MVKYSLFALLVLISLAYVMSAPASNEEAIEPRSPAVGEGEVEDVQPAGTKKIKRGIYGGGYGYGFGHYPYYSYYPYGHYGGYGHSYYPYYYQGFGHGYGHGYGYLW